jgi:hypothetical protein
MSDDLNLVPYGAIDQRILLIRGQKVMLDADLAALYGVETRALKRAVTRNQARFPEDFMFQVSPQEYQALRRQFGTLKRGQHAKYLPYAFMEKGVAMLSGVLKSPRAAQANVAIMRAFVRMRQAIETHRALARKLEELEVKVGTHDEEIQLIFKALKQLMAEHAKRKKPIGIGAKEHKGRYGKVKKSHDA